MSESYTPKHMAPANAAAGPSNRVEAFDLIRGIALISMIAFHTCYDLAYIAVLPQASWFAPPLETFWRNTISWTFIVVAGCMCLYSRSNLKRAAKYLAVALLVWAATSLASADTPISFGIIYCMGACTLVYALLERIRSALADHEAAGVAPVRPMLCSYAYAALFFAAFLALLGLKNGTVWAFGLNLLVPSAPYDTGWLAWLGFPGKGFASGDYYPLLPYLLLFLSGASLMTCWKVRPSGLPRFLRVRTPAPFRWVAFVGRHTLLIYLLHQPIILGILMLAGIV